jgi:hypothetical protein
MNAPNNRSQLTGVAGVHYVAAYLSFLGYHAVPTTRNVRGPDVLVSTVDGTQGVSLQVKTTTWAMRTRGRGPAKQPDHYEWDIGWNSAILNHQRLLFALVDLKDFTGLPDVYVIPSNVIFRYFEGGDPAVWRRARYHPSIVEVDQYRNNWSILKDHLTE